MSPYPKRLIEVDLPIKRISEHARREKSIRHGHISTLHIWWARRPLAACRAVICAALWPDPADPLCPQSFRDDASRLINEFARKAATDKDLSEHCAHDTWPKWQTLSRNGGLDSTNEAHWNVLRFALLDFIADFANWDNSTVKVYLETSRALTQAAHVALGGIPRTRPLVVDPFAGGGAIPLEVLRAGADAFSSDLNPVAVLLNKVVLEYIPKYGGQLAVEVRRWGEWVKRSAEKDLVQFYPLEPDGTSPMAYIWARTILSEAPGEGEIPVEVPLIRSMWLSSKPARRWALRWAKDIRGRIKTETVKVVYADGIARTVRRPLLEIFQPKSPSEVESGTSQGGAATCPISGYTNSVERVREQLKMRTGGAADARLLCVVTTPKNAQGRVYRLPNEQDVQVAMAAQRELTKRQTMHDGPMPMLPEGKLNHLRGFFNVVLYGMTTWGDLFSARQALSLSYLVGLTKQVSHKFQDREFGVAVQTCLALALDRCADKCASVVVWNVPGEKVEHVFGRQALPMVWDYAEANILSDIGWSGACEWVEKAVEHTASCHLQQGTATTASATSHPLPDDASDAVVTDPPYYAAIPYADLSDFFYSWLRRSVGEGHAELFKTELAPKDEECVSLSHRAAMYRNKDAAWFEGMMTKACAECRRIVKPSGVGVFVFANKETSGWEAMLAALIASGWVITASWPIDTEMTTRLRARNSAVLASSVHLVCRPRDKKESSFDASSVGDWRDVLAELPDRIHLWMPRLAAEGVVGADAIFACLGPALEVFSRYARVETAAGQAVPLADVKGENGNIVLNGYLSYVWAAVAKEALNMIFVGADATGFEEDARLTAMWLWTLKTGPEDSTQISLLEAGEDEDEEDSGKKAKPVGFVLEYDAARKIAQGLGAHLERLEQLVEIKGETARLLLVSERAHYLFGKGEGAATIQRRSGPKQLAFEAILGEAEQAEGGWGEKAAPKVGNTVLDRVHQSMLLFGAGRGEALKRFLVEGGAGSDQRFWRLAQALSALYPSGTDERRWVEGVMARKKGLGF
jgi:adenine-specific DNA methylase